MMTMILAAGFLTQVYAAKIDSWGNPKPPLRIAVDCEWSLGTSIARTTFTLDTTAVSAHPLDISISSPGNEIFLFSIAPGGYSARDGRVTSQNFVLHVTPVFDPNMHNIGGEEEKATGEWLSNYRPDVVSAGRLGGQYKAWVEIAVRPDGMIEAHVTEGRRRRVSEGGDLVFELAYTLREDPEGLPSGNSLFGIPVEAFRKSVKLFKASAEKGLEIEGGYRMVLKVRLSITSESYPADVLAAE